MSKALERLLVQNAAEIDAQMKRLEGIKKKLLEKNATKLSPEELIKSENQAAEVDILINQLKYNLNPHHTFDIGHLERMDKEAKKSGRLAFRIPKVKV